MSALTLRQAGDGDHHWLLGVLATVKAGAEETGGSMTIAEFEAPPGWAVPPHRHLDQDELFYVLDGEVTFWCDGAESTFTRGGMAWLPRQKPHLFSVSDAGPARLFNIHTGSSFERLVHDLGEPATEPRIPDPPTVEPDPAAIAAGFAAHGIELLPPESIGLG
jgi:quercetin dioxygenase-like cupin family protein